MISSNRSRSLRRLALSCLLAAAPIVASGVPSVAASQRLSSIELPTESLSSKVVSRITGDAVSRFRVSESAPIGGIQIVVHQARPDDSATFADKQDADASHAGQPRWLGTHDSWPRLGDSASVGSVVTSRRRAAKGVLVRSSGVDETQASNEPSASAAVTPLAAARAATAATAARASTAARALRTIASAASTAAARRSPTWWKGRPASPPKTSARHLGAAELGSAGRYRDPCLYERLSLRIDAALTDLKSALDERLDRSVADVTPESSGSVVAFVDFPDAGDSPTAAPRWIGDPNFEVGNDLSLRRIVRSGDSARPDWEQHDDAKFDAVSTADLMRQQLDALAATEPIDVTGPSDAWAAVTALPTDRSITGLRRFTGAGPVIATLRAVDDRPLPRSVSVLDSSDSIGQCTPVPANRIGERYRPYDLTATDYRLWSSLPSPDRRVCNRVDVGSADRVVGDHVVGDQGDGHGIDPRIVEAETSFDYYKYGSLDCVAEDLRHHVDAAIAGAARLGREFDASEAGRRLAILQGSVRRLVARTAISLASQRRRVDSATGDRPHSVFELTPSISRRVAPRAEAPPRPWRRGRVGLPPAAIDLLDSVHVSSSSSSVRFAGDTLGFFTSGSRRATGPTTPIEHDTELTAAAEKLRDFLRSAKTVTERFLR